MAAEGGQQRSGIIYCLELQSLSKEEWTSACNPGSPYLRDTLFQFFVPARGGPPRADSWSIIDYKCATILDCPASDTVIVETEMGHGPYGTVGVGEDVATMIPALLGPAVYNAIGVWVDDFPITPEKVLKALGKI